MKKDKFEDFINRNRKDFEFDTPGKDDLWQSISTQLQNNQKEARKPWQFASIAAAILLVLATIMWLPSLQSQDGNLQLSEEFVDTEQFYQSEIKTYSMQLSSYDPSYATLLKDFDEGYDRLVADFKSTGDINVLERMIDIQRAKLQALKSLLEEIKVKEERHEISL